MSGIIHRKYWGDHCLVEARNGAKIKSVKIKIPRLSKCFTLKNTYKMDKSTTNMTKVGTNIATEVGGRDTEECIMVGEGVIPTFK